MTNRCIELVKKFEGFSPKIYLCPAGYLTVGYGHVVIPSEREKFEGRIITEQEAEKMLIEDLLKTEICVMKLLNYMLLHPYCYDALISFTFNVGIYAFRASTLRRKILSNQLNEAVEQFGRWVYAGGRKLNGLIRRRQAEKELFMDGIYAMT